MTKAAATTSPKLSLTQLRKKRGFDSMSAFARACDVNRVTVWRWETGRRGLSAETCKIVADVLSVPMETVFQAVSN